MWVEEPAKYLHSPQKFQARVKHHDKAWAEFRQHHIVRVIGVGADDDSFIWLHEAVISIEILVTQQQPNKFDIWHHRQVLPRGS